MSTESFQIGELILNAGTQEVTLNGQAIPLPPLSFQLLLTLARHAPNVVTMQKLEDEVWSGLVVDRGTINKRALLVRKALAEAGCPDDYITVVRGSGYRISVPVERLPDCVDCIDQPVQPAEVVEVAKKSKRPLGLGGAAILTVVSLLVVLAFRYLPETLVDNPGETTNEKPVGLGEVQALMGMRSVAVMPFEVSNDDVDDQFLGDGIAREVTGLLSTVPGLRVASSSSAFALRDSEEALAGVSARLGVSAILTGTIHRFGNKMHVMANLVEVDTGYSVWTASYNRELDDVFSIQDDIALNVATSLKGVLAEGERPDSRIDSTRNVEAFTHFLKGRSLMDERISKQSEVLVQSKAEFERAIELDPFFVRAHVGLAAVDFLLPAYDSSLDREAYYDQAETSARYALDLNGKSSGALGVLAAIMVRRGEPLQAANLFQRARELGDADPNILHWHAMHFTSMGYFEGLVPILESAYRLDPLNALLGCSLASALTLSGNPQESTRVLNGMIRFSRRDLGLALASLYTGDYQTAREMLRNIELRAGVLGVTHADLLVAAFEDPLRYPTVEDTFVQDVQSGQLGALVAFEALLIMGSPRAFDLEVDLAGSPFEYSLPEPVWNNWGVGLRRDPRFKSWIRTLGYDRYWREYGWPDRCRPTGMNDFECV